MQRGVINQFQGKDVQHQNQTKIYFRFTRFNDYFGRWQQLLLTLHPVVPHTP